MCLRDSHPMTIPAHPMESCVQKATWVAIITAPFQDKIGALPNLNVLVISIGRLRKR